jgi:hypothetical protein
LDKEKRVGGLFYKLTGLVLNALAGLRFCVAANVFNELWGNARFALTFRGLFYAACVFSRGRW